MLWLLAIVIFFGYDAFRAVASNFSASRQRALLTAAEERELTALLTEEIVEESTRFVTASRDIVIGQPEAAAHGVRSYMQVDNSGFHLFKGAAQVLQAVRAPGGASRPVSSSPSGKDIAPLEAALSACAEHAGCAAVVEEFWLHGTAEDWTWLEYVAAEPAVEAMVPHGRRDAGRDGERLGDFLGCERAGQAGLCGGHVLALRLYTTPAFKSLNGPLRDVVRGPAGEPELPVRMRSPHKFPATLTLITEALMKLRASRTDRPQGKASGDAGAAPAPAPAPAAAASDDPHHQLDLTRRMKEHRKVRDQPLWRGMKDVSLSEAFMQLGGSELAPMSTTEDIRVAAKFAASREAVLFKMRPHNFMQRGPALSWLSCFPEEREVLFPPLTYLECSGRTQVVQVGELMTYTVVEVVPYFPTG